MSDDLIEALRRAQHAGSVAFELRDPEDAIRPARRRVRRHKAAVGGATALSAVAVVGAAGWGISQVPFAANEAADVHVATGGTPESATDEQAGGRDDVAVTGEDLLVGSEPYVRGDADAGRQRGQVCTLGTDENPRLADADPATTDAYVIADCDARWFADAPLLALDPFEVALGSIEGSGIVDTINVAWTVTNVSDSPIELDQASASGALTLDRDGEWADDYSADGLNVAATSLWQSDTTVLTALHRRTNVVKLLPGETIRGESRWAPGRSDAEALERMVAGEPATFTLFVRVPSADDYAIENVMLELRHPKPFTLTLTDR